MRSRLRFAADVGSCWLMCGKLYFVGVVTMRRVLVLIQVKQREIWIALRFFLAENSTETVGVDFGKSLGCGCRTCACLDTSGTASNKKAMPVF